MAHDEDVRSATDDGRNGVGHGTNFDLGGVFNTCCLTTEEGELVSIVGNDDLVATTGECDIDGVVSHIVKLRDIREVVSNTDGKGKRNILFLFSGTDFLDNRESVFFHAGEGVVVADHEVGVGFDTTDEDTIFMAVVVDEGTDLQNLLRHLIDIR